MDEEACRRLATELLGLCDSLASRVDLADVRDYARYGEYGLAFEVLVDRCITPAAELTLEELERAAALGEAMGLRSAWVDLVACLGPASLSALPDRLRALAREQVTREIPQNPVRAEWLARLRSLLPLA
jgi:hypothetical protein